MKKLALAIALILFAGSAMGRARILRRLWPQAPSIAKTASPTVPLSRQRARRSSVFMWPISGSMALRQCRSLASTGVMPRRVPLIRTRVVSTPYRHAQNRRNPNGLAAIGYMMPSSHTYSVTLNKR